MISSDFLGKSFISVDQITSRVQLDSLFLLADAMGVGVDTHTTLQSLVGMTVAILFYQPSTRTFSSFEAAARRLGATVIAIHGMDHYSSVSKGETLDDTIRSIYQTTGADVIILRHPDNDSSEVAVRVSPVPIVNAGSGTKEHPTQALLDLYTIYTQMGRIDNLRMVMVGDLKYGRTIKSLTKLLVKVGKGNSFTFVSPKELSAPQELIAHLANNKAKVVERHAMGSSLQSADVVYMTRVQKEWFVAEGKLNEYEHLKNAFVLDSTLANQMPKKAIIMHPLPRVGEILHEVDTNPRAVYFKQMRSGLLMRMALLQAILKG